MKKVYVSDETNMVLASLKNIDANHALFHTFYEKEVPNHFHVQVYENAKVYRYAIVSENAEVFGNARVYGYAIVSGNAKVYENAKVSGNAMVYENAEVFGNAKVYGNARVYENAEVFGYAMVYENAKVYGNAEVYRYAKVYENAKVYGNAEVFGNARVFENIEVTNNAINLIGLPYTITITDNHIVIGCKMFDFETAKKLGKKDIENLGIDNKEYQEIIKYKDFLLELIKIKENENEV